MNNETKFAPAKRSDATEIINDYDLLNSLEYLGSIFGSVSGMAAILNSNRQVVYANGEFLAASGMKAIDELLGSRPGEAVSCIHADREPGGCGTAEACRYCGAVNAVLESQATGKKAARESRITIDSGGTTRSLDLLITALPFSYRAKKYTIVTMQDMSSEKRRAGLERIFFHDTLDLASGINGALQVISEMEDKNCGSDLINASEKASSELIEEIRSFKELTQAEKGELVMNKTQANSLEVLSSAITITKHLPETRQKTLIVDKHSDSIELVTDSRLLSRVLVNMLKNAVEATPEGGEVHTGAVNAGGNRVRFYVKNDSVMSDEEKLQVFQRSFSTKGKDRGLGTYSMKLLGEKYLGGRVGFLSSEGEGTEFYVELEVEGEHSPH